MIEHYDAFISYRHAKLDSKIAEHVQRKLERFHVPHKLAQKSEKKKITRIFRDKDELPITSDLSDSISYALEKAEYLIVICSTNTKESIWVDREIKYFLQHHPMNKVLTVICDGEPEEVIPEVLMKEFREVEDEDGNTHTVEIMHEPLSCDYRLPMGTADKEELPRLAAAILGCSYDELMRRRRKYKIQRLSIIFSIALAVALAFGGYMVYSKHEIKQHYEEAMYRRALYLAGESQRLYEDHNRVDALQLALAAMPSEENPDMPVTAQGIKALSDAVGAYRSKSRDLMRLSVDWNYKLPNDVKSMEVSPSGLYLAACDNAGVFTLWDTKTHTEIFSKQCAPIFYTYMSDDDLLVVETNSIYVIKTSDGSIKWDNTPDPETAYLDSCTFSEDKVLVFDTCNKLWVYDSKSGKKLNDFELRGNEFINTYEFTDAFLDVSPDGRRLAVGLTTLTDIVNRILIINIENGEKMEIVRDQDKDTIFSDQLQALIWIDDETIAFTESDLLSNIKYYQSVSERPALICCMNVNSKEIIWEKEVRFGSNEIPQEGMLNLPSRDGFAYFSGNSMWIFDTKTGEILNRFQLNDQILSMSDRLGSGFPTLVLRNGAIGFTAGGDDGDDSVYVLDGLIPNISQGIVASGVYVIEKDSNVITYYASELRDEDWTPIGGEAPVIDSTLFFSYSDDTYYLCVGSNDSLTISTIDIATATYTGSVTYEIAEDYKLHDFFLFEDEVYLIFDIGYTADMIICKVSGDSLVDVVTLSNIGTGRKMVEEVNGIIYYFPKIKVDDRDMFGFGYYDIKTGETQEFETELSVSLDLSRMFILDEGKYVIFSTPEADYIYDSGAKELERLATPSEFHEIRYADGMGDRFVLSDEASVVLTSRERDDFIILDTFGLMARGVFVYDDNTVLVFTDNGIVLRYDLKTGEYKGLTQLRGFDSGSHINIVDDITIEKSADFLIIKCYEAAFVIDPTSWEQSFMIEELIKYDERSDRFFTVDVSGPDLVLGYFKHYTVDDLIRKAKDLLAGKEMTQEEKQIYGI